jgi:hypothetical protein
MVCLVATPDGVALADYELRTVTLATDYDALAAERDAWREQAVDRVADWKKCEVERDALKAQLTTAQSSHTNDTERCDTCEHIRFVDHRRPSPTAQGPEEGACGTCGGKREVQEIVSYGMRGSRCEEVPCPDCTPSAKAGAVSEEQYLGEMIDWVQAMGEYGSEDGDERMAARVVQRLRSTPAPDVQEKQP